MNHGNHGKNKFTYKEGTMLLALMMIFCSACGKQEAEEPLPAETVIGEDGLWDPEKEMYLADGISETDSGQSEETETDEEEITSDEEDDDRITWEANSRDDTYDDSRREENSAWDDPAYSNSSRDNTSSKQTDTTKTPQSTTKTDQDKTDTNKNNNTSDRKDKLSGRANADTGSGIPQTLSVGSAVPDFTVDLTDGSDFMMSDYDDDVVVLGFWSTGNENSLKIFPTFEKLDSEYGAEAEFLGINDKESIETVDKYVNDHEDYVFDVAYDVSGKVSTYYPKSSLPYILVVNQGIVYKVITTVSDSNQLYQDIRSAIKACGVDVDAMDIENANDDDA
ncbi:MAG: TlpA family protein disulfide reductase [Lachnospiraceae bacterium]|nr:TlpA family protein disulfide reductase [Lachnospiraceae bacterium]